MDRPIIYPQEQVRSYDTLSGYENILLAESYLAADLGIVSPSIAGWAPSYNSNLTVTLGAGRIYYNAVVDSSAYGSLPANGAVVLRQGNNPGQILTFTTAAISSGQSQWALVEVEYAQNDVILAGDPTAGVLTYANPANPTQPFIGPNNAGAPQPTLRQAQANLQIIYGTAATTGSETPPAVSGGYSPIYLVHLTFGQTSITSANLFVAGPTATPNPPSYAAPFFLNTTNGALVYQNSPQSILTATVTAVLFDTESYKTISGFHSTSSNTSRLVAGQAGVNYARITGQVTVTGNATGYREVQIYKNGVSMVPSIVSSVAATLTTTTDWVQIESPILPVAVNDYFEVMITQSSGATLSLIANGSWAQLEVVQ